MPPEDIANEFPTSLSLGIAKGMTVTLIADGQDEDAALDGLTALINSGFAE